MDTTITKPRLWRRWKEAKQLGLLAAFEDSATGTRVREFCQGLSRDLGGHCRITEHVWLFGTLRLRELRAIAAEEASASDLVIISVHQAQSLPEEVKSWIELWLQQKARHPGVLLALFDLDHAAGPGSVETYLQEVASRGGMEFLVESAEVAEYRWQGR
jgi:hypothetical protein